MLHAWLRRIAQLLPVWLGIVTSVFFLSRSIPGSPADLVLGPDAAQADKEAWLEQYHFHLPLLEQYGLHLLGWIQGDIGNSYVQQVPVWDLILPRAMNSLALALSSFFVSISVALVIGLWGASKPFGWRDRILSWASLAAISAPTFVVGPILLWIFSVQLRWLPLFGMNTWSSYVLPSATLGLALAAFSGRMIRAGMVETMQEDYVRTARAKGVHPSAVLWIHGLRNACLPTLTVLGLQMGVLISGTVITEQIFSWPGLGMLTIEAVQQRDTPLISGCVTMMALAFVGSNFLVDLLFPALDPRLRRQD